MAYRLAPLYHGLLLCMFVLMYDIRIKFDLLIWCVVYIRPGASSIYSAEKAHNEGLMILLCWYGAKGQCLILLSCHFLYSKPRGHKVVVKGSKVASILSKAIPTDFSCHTDSEKV